MLLPKWNRLNLNKYYIHSSFSREIYVRGCVLVLGKKDLKYINMKFVITEDIFEKTC